MPSAKLSELDQQVSITGLAAQISDLSDQVAKYLKDHSFSELGFNALSPTEVPDDAEYEKFRAPLNDAALDLLRMVNGPKATLRELFFSHYDLAALQVALDRKLFTYVPLPDGNHPSGKDDLLEGATAEEIAQKAGMDEDRSVRVLRLLATHRIFEEFEDDGGSVKFRHTANSAMFARDADFSAMADMQMDDMLRAVSETSASIAHSPHASSAIYSPFHERFGASMYQYYEQNPKKGTRFSQAMSSWSQIDRQVSDLRDSFPWKALNDGSVVDIGGGSGHISIALARIFPALRFTVQDISPHQLSQARESIAADSALSSRIHFQQHDFFTPQPSHDVQPSAFLLRQVIHNYNDDDSIRILRGIIPALEQSAPGTPLLINDVVLPDSGTAPRYEEHHLRQVDFCMMVALGAKQRTETEFIELLGRADERLEVTRIVRNSMGVGLVEAALRKI